MARTYQEIVGLVGREPEYEEKRRNGDRVVTWSSTNFWTARGSEVVLVFDRYGVCAGYADEPRADASNRPGGVGLGLGFIFDLQ
jgi:hypothetical protein